MSGAAQIRLGLIGYGEIGSTLGAGLRRSGLAEVVSYDKYAFDGPYAGLIQRRARAVGVPLLRSAAELAERAEVIIGATPGSASIASAEALASHLRPHHLVADIASVTPKVKQAVAERLAGSGAGFVDGSIVGTPKDGHTMPILLAGTSATRLRDTLVPWGMDLTVVGERIGDASAIKILRSVV